MREEQLLGMDFYCDHAGAAGQTWTGAAISVNNSMAQPDKPVKVLALVSSIRLVYRRMIFTLYRSEWYSAKKNQL